MPPQKSKGRPPGQKHAGRAPKASRDEARYPVPQRSARAWQSVKPQQHICLNPGLIFDRFVQDWGWHEQQLRDKEAKKKAWQEIVAIAPRADADLLAEWNERWQEVARAANAEPFILTAVPTFRARNSITS